MRTSKSTGKSKSMDQPTKNEKKERFHMRMNSALKAAAQKVAEKEGRSLANWIEHVMRQRIDGRE